MKRAGDVVGNRYRVHSVLGRGGFGAVYEAEDLTLGRRVALKHCWPQPQEDPASAAADFLKEAQVLQGVRHPGLCAVLDFVVDAGERYLAMELVPGESLEDYVQRRGRMDPAELQSVLRQTLEALDHLHTGCRPPVVHRDFKPANLRRDPSGRVVLVDFGLARPRRPGQRDTQILGTPGFAAPEQYQGLSQPGSDLYAWACTIFYLATGHYPQSTPPPFPPLRSLRPDLPSALEEVLEACKDPTPERRPTARQALRHLEGGRFYQPGAPSTTPSGCPHCGDGRPPLARRCPNCLLSPDLFGAPAAAWLARGQQYAAGHCHLEAAAHFAKARSLGWTGADLDLAEARALERSGRPAEALRLLQNLPDCGQVRLERARCLARLGRVEEARALLATESGLETRVLHILLSGGPGALPAARALRQAHPAEPSAVVLEAILLQNAGRVQEGLSLLEGFLEQHPDSVLVLREAARLALEAAELEKALMRLRSWRRLLPDDPESLLLLARVKHHLGRIPEAREHYLEYLALRPEDPEARFHYAGFLAGPAGAPGEAVDLLRGLESRPDWKERVGPVLGLALLRSHQYEAACRVLEKVVRQRQDSELYAHYAQALAQLGRLEEARAWAHRALALDPGCQAARMLLTP